MTRLIKVVPRCFLLSPRPRKRGSVSVWQMCQTSALQLARAAYFAPHKELSSQGSTPVRWDVALHLPCTFLPTSSLILIGNAPLFTSFLSHAFCHPKRNTPTENHNADTMSSPSQSPRMRDSRRLPPPPAAGGAASTSPSPSPLASPSPSSPAPLAPSDEEGGLLKSGDGAADDNDDEYGYPASQDIPLTMTASTVLLNLPRDATAALATAGRFVKDKVIVRFKPVGSAPPLSGGGGAGGGGGGAAADVRRKISSTQKFEVVVAFVRRALRVKESESVFLYINSSFAPALDEVVGNLHQVCWGRVGVVRLWRHV
jgi:ubiquitin-like protein ATG12